MRGRSAAQNPTAPSSIAGDVSVEATTCSKEIATSVTLTEQGEPNLTAGIALATLSPQEANCLKIFYSLSERANEKFLVRVAEVEEFLEHYRNLPSGSSVKGDIAHEINKRGVSLQTPILSACLAKISTHFVTLCDIAAELLISGYKESSKAHEVLILSQLVYCIGVGGDREKRLLSASSQLAKIVDTFFENNSITDRYPDRVSNGWLNLIESLNLLSRLPEPLACSLYKALPATNVTAKISLVSILPIIEEAPLSFFSYAPTQNTKPVASLGVHLLSLAKTPLEQRKVTRILSARIEEFHKHSLSQENPFAQPLMDLLSQLDVDPDRGEKLPSGGRKATLERPLEVSTFASVIKLTCKLLECGEPRPFHQLCSLSSKRLLEVKKKTLLMVPLSEYPSVAMQEEAVRSRVEPLLRQKGRVHPTKLKQSVEALSFAAENFDVPSLTRLFETHVAPLARGKMGLLWRIVKNDSVLAREPEIAAAVSRVVERIPRTREVESIKRVIEKSSQKRT